MKNSIKFALIGLTIFTNVSSQLITDPTIKNEFTKQHWDASWVRVPDTQAYEYGVYFFRNEIEIKAVPDKYIIHVSADNRYKLFVNNEWVGLGPARSDADNWIYETYDIAAYLKPGKNVVSAQVWNFGEFKPWAQISIFTGFIVQGDSENSSGLNTPGTWKCTKVEAYRPYEVDRAALGSFIIVGPGERINGSEYPWGWKEANFDFTNWKSPSILGPGSPKGVGTDITHALVKRTIPAMELSYTSPPFIRQINDKEPGPGLPSILNNFRVAANTSVRILLDEKELVNAYPEFLFSGGSDARVKVSYAEALFDVDGRKVHRDSVRNLTFKGNSDLFLLDGGDKRSYTTLWFRTFRYILLEISTGEEELVLHSLAPIKTGYPFSEKAYFRCDNPEIQAIWETGWRTSLLCANEIYYDCPYYEQMQYVGDTRIQALISMYVSGDDRLMRKAISDFFNSMTPEGLTQSRYPSEPRQIIPTYSLFWISMIHDYLWHRNDYLFAGQYLVSIQHILQWFENHIDANTGLLGPIEYWPFVDWTEEWAWDNEKRIGGVPPGGIDGSSSIITLQYAMTLDQAADIFSFFGLDKLSKSYSDQADALVNACKKLCWDESRKLFADTPEMISFSQHANSLALLTNAVPKEEKALFMERVLRDSSLVQASLYFRYYVHRAAIEAGLGNKYLTFLKPWENMIDQGLTTFAEIPNTKSTRSDCHAWSSSPLYEFLATVAGIKPGGVGFETVIIEPHPGDLKWIEAGMPHYFGDIALDLKFGKDGGVKGSIRVPPGLKGIFIWDNQTLDLKPGKQNISMKSIDSRFNLSR